MKSKIKENSSNFKPFTLELNIETVQEARLLFHIFNYADIRQLFLSGNAYSMESYSSDIGRIDNKTFALLSSYIKNSGEKI